MALKKSSNGSVLLNHFGLRVRNLMSKVSENEIFTEVRFLLFNKSLFQMYLMAAIFSNSKVTKPVSARPLAFKIVCLSLPI